MQIGDNLHEMSDPVFFVCFFLGGGGVKKKKNIISLSSAEFAYRVIKVKVLI